MTSTHLNDLLLNLKWLPNTFPSFCISRVQRIAIGCVYISAEHMQDLGTLWFTSIFSFFLMFFLDLILPFFCSNTQCKWHVWLSQFYFTHFFSWEFFPFIAFFLIDRFYETKENRLKLLILQLHLCNRLFVFMLEWGEYYQRATRVNCKTNIK